MATCSRFTRGIGESTSNPMEKHPGVSGWGELAGDSSCSEAQRQSTANRGKGRMSPSRFLFCREEPHANYERVVNNYIKPNLGGMQLAKLAVIHIQSLYARLTKDGKSS